jgi:hypothetical protein
MGLLPTPQGNAAPLDAPAQGVQPPQGDPNAPAQGEEESNVSPEEQQLYDTVVKKAGDIIYGDGKVMPEILHSLEPAREPAKDPAGGNPAVLALANTAVQIVSKLDISSKEQNIEIPDDVLYHAGAEIIEMLAEVAEAAKIHDYTQEEINGALVQAVDSYRTIAERMGRTNDETLKGQFKEILDADSQGRLGDVVPGLGDQTVGEPPVQPNQPEQ